LSTQPEVMIQRIEELVRRRLTTDRRMSYGWLIVPLLPILVGIALAASLVRVIISLVPEFSSFEQPQEASRLFGEIFVLYGVAIMSLFLVLLLGAFALYNLLDRRNAHFRRQQQLFVTLAKYLATKAGVSSSSKLTLIAEDSVFEEQERPAGLWSILYVFVTPIIGLVVAYNLTQDLRKHEERQSNYYQVLLGTLGEIGITATPMSLYKSHKRDPLLYIILTAITGGIFWIYWFYTLLKDYNEHFADHSSFEEQLLAALKPTTPPRVCAACGGSVPENARFCPYCGAAQRS